MLALKSRNRRVFFLLFPIKWSTYLHATGVSILVWCTFIYFYTFLEYYTFLHSIALGLLLATNSFYLWCVSCRFTYPVLWRHHMSRSISMSRYNVYPFLHIHLSRTSYMFYEHRLMVSAEQICSVRLLLSSMYSSNN